MAGLGAARRVATPEGTCDTGPVSWEPALFRRFPAARERIPHRAFLSGVTPVEPLALEGVPEGRLWVKRDERCSPLYGGNKPRKLEFVIGRALARGARRLVTTGGLGTHHGLATTILGRAAGLATTLVLVDQPVTDHVCRSLALFRAWGAELVYGRTVAGAAAATLRVLARSTWRGERPYLVATGGSGPVGNLGFVSAGLELAEQVEAGRLPAPAQLYLPVGTGGTAAGLLAGLRLGGLATRVVPVLVTDILPPSASRMARAARATLARLRRADPSVPALAIAADDFRVVTAQVGPGYGAATPAARAAREAGAASGLALETTYTAKCVAEIRARAARGELEPGPILYWNTWSQVDVEATAPRPPDEAALPEPFARLVRVARSEGVAA